MLRYIKDKRGWAKLYTRENQFLHKYVTIFDEAIQADRLFVMGGQKEQRSSQTAFNIVEEFIIPKTAFMQYKQQEKAPMNNARSSFGAALSFGRKEIYVVGGYANS